MSEQLRAFVERIERMDEEIKTLNDDKRDIYAEAKSNGFDVKALKAVIAYRRKDASEAAEHSAIVETYLAALSPPATQNNAPATNVVAKNGHSDVPSRARAHEGQTEGIPDFLRRSA